MAESFNVQLISPEKVFFSNETREVNLPLFDGYSTIMPNHSPMIAEMGPGFVTIDNAAAQSYFVFKGFVHIDAASVLILSENFFLKEALTYERISEQIEKIGNMLDHMKQHVSVETMEQISQQEVALNQLISFRDFGPAF